MESKADDTERFRAKINHAMIHHGRELARDIGATAVLVCVDTHLSDDELEALVAGDPILAAIGPSVAEHLEELGAAPERVLRLPSTGSTRTGQVKVAVMLALSRGLIQSSDLVVCVSGSPRHGINDSLTVMDISQELEIFSSRQIDIATHMDNPHVFDRLLTLALELAHEGKEGKPLGTTFVLGDHEKVLEMSSQLVINPFAAVAESERNILEPPVKEVIREFAAIDGAFVVRDDGVVLAAGRHLNVSAETADLPQGLGARHRSAAGITALTDAFAIVVSESTGDVRIFSRGRMFMEIERGAGRD